MFEATELDGELFFNAKESVSIERKVSDIYQSSIHSERTVTILSSLASPVSQT
jgi:hypothetical protein